MKAKHLEEHDLKYIQDNLNLTASELARRLDKPRPKIAKILKELKNVESLGTNPSIFDEIEVQYILANKDVLTYDEIAFNLNKGTRSSVHRTIIKFFPNHKKSTSKPWSKEQDKLFIANYYIKSNKELSEICRINEGVIQYHARRLNLDPTKRNRTSIEYYTACYLEQNNIKYLEQWSFDKYRYDFYLPELNALVEVQGDYWHANPSIYSDKAILTSVQLSNLERDVLKKQVALEANFRLVYLWEKDIKENILNLNEFFNKEFELQLSS